MSVTLLSIGRPIPIVQNQIYALPGGRCLLFSDASAPTFFQSNTEAFTVSVALTLVDGMSEVAGGFIRCTSASPGNVTLKNEGRGY